MGVLDLNLYRLLDRVSLVVVSEVNDFLLSAQVAPLSDLDDDPVAGLGPRQLRFELQVQEGALRKAQHVRLAGGNISAKRLATKKEMDKRERERGGMTI